METDRYEEFVIIVDYNPLYHNYSLIERDCKKGLRHTLISSRNGEILKELKEPRQ